MKTILSYLLLIATFQVCGQNSAKVIIQVNNGDRVIVWIDNKMKIVTQQCNPVKLEDVSAKILSKGDAVSVPLIEFNGFFIFKPEIIGTLEISVKIGDEVVTQTFHVVPFEAVGRIGGKAHSESKLSVGEFKAQMGLAAVIEGYDISGKCNVLQYEIIRMCPNGQYQKVLNKGALFDKNGQAIIERCVVGDLYLFRNIQYQCPGADAPQKTADISIEVK